MTLVTLPYRPSNLDPEDISQIVADFDSVLNVLNGDIREDNLAVAKIVSPQTHLKQDSASNRQALLWDGVTDNRWEPKTIGDLLKAIHYAPADSNYSTTGTSFADVDATNLAVTFRVPASGMVMVVLSATSGGASSPQIFWNLRDSGGDITNSARWIHQAGGAAVFMAMPIFMSGLSAGTEVTWKWGWKVSTGTGYLYKGVGTTAYYNPPTMQVFGVAA